MRGTGNWIKKKYIHKKSTVAKCMQLFCFKFLSARCLLLQAFVQWAGTPGCYGKISFFPCQVFIKAFVSVVIP